MTHSRDCSVTCQLDPGQRALQLHQPRETHSEPPALGATGTSTAMASKKDMRRTDLIIPFVEPEKEAKEGDMQSTIASTMPMMAVCSFVVLRRA